MNFQKAATQMKAEKIAAVTTIVICVISVIDIIRYAILGNGTTFLAMLIVNVLFILCALGAFAGRLYPLYLLVTIAAGALFVFTNHLETTMFNFTFGIQAAVSLLGAVAGSIHALRRKEKPTKEFLPYCIVMLCILAVCGIVWGAGTATDRAKTTVSSNIWAVPSVYDSVESMQPGTLERLDYDTRAYATDERAVTKTAWVYLPYGYDASKRYNILYLMHGTGDNEEYWLKTYAYNKVMIDNLIEKGDIDPLIIVTPTFYVENDCADDLDQLTYSFKQELRNDLMPAVEGKYSTYAATPDDAGFKESRDHRAFAGLSRGAVTTLHSAFCGSLDYFSWFGTFSASRTPVAYYVAANQTDETKDLSIHYWFVSSGTFDFGYVSQITDYKAIMAVEPRLVSGENTSFTVYPMRYHSIGNWHLALYNCLQHLF